MTRRGPRLSSGSVTEFFLGVFDMTGYRHQEEARVKSFKLFMMERLLRELDNCWSVSSTYEKQE